mmetsp:Transcript_16654/g.28193  ORF Transcript_16654/g.28193 Transcript_16654/m.28193 type:complete len:203 (+) Transcript_16654:2204-2812(+)
MNFFTASPLRGAMRAYVFSGMAMAMSVFTIALPPLGITRSYALLRSKPAANSEPRVGVRARLVSFLTIITSSFGGGGGSSTSTPAGASAPTSRRRLCNASPSALVGGAGEGNVLVPGPPVPQFSLPTAVASVLVVVAPAGTTGTGGAAIDEATPVLPKPPAPRTDAGRSSPSCTSCATAMLMRSSTNCATRSPRCTSKSSAP